MVTSVGVKGSLGVGEIKWLLWRLYEIMCVKLLEIMKHYRIYRTFHSMKKKFFFLGRNLDATMGGTLPFGLECFLDHYGALSHFMEFAFWTGLLLLNSS